MATDPSSSPVRWTEVRVLAPSGWHELVAAELEQGPCTSVVFGATSIGMVQPPEGFELVRTYLRQDEDDEATRAAIAERLAGLAERCQEPELEGLRAEFRRLPPEDYASTWRKSWKPFRVYDLCVVPPWYGGALRPGDVRMTLEPGGSFGSGRHATTRTCLKVLQDRMEGGERVLDAGTGSGILAVCAVLLGAREVLGFDIDPASKQYGESLAKANGVAKRTRFRLGDFSVLEPDDEGFHVVLANIYSDIIQESATDLRDRLRPGGWFAFSGCPKHHVEATRDAILATGLEIEEERLRGRWMTFVGRRPR